MSTTVGRPADGVSEIGLGDELSLFDAATGQALSLNRTASDLWALADGVSTVDHVIATLAHAYGVAAAVVADDVTTALAALTDAGVLVPRRS